MPDTSLHFQLPENLKVKKLLKKLGDAFSLVISQQQYSIKQYFDSFDWRLYRAGLLCELNQSKSESKLRLLDLDSGLPLISTDIDEVPSFAAQFIDTDLKKLLTPVLDIRALIALTSQPYQAYHINILNKDSKTTARIVVEEYESLPHRLYILPLRGYEKTAMRLSLYLEQKLALKAGTKPVLNAALKLQGRKALDYSSKLDIQLDPKMRADIACKFIFSHLLQSIKVNEAGTIKNTDSEFLHDFRVAVRRTRSGLSQLKDVLPVESTREYADFFAWLGQITNQTRDLDVYLLKFADYQQQLPETMQADLIPLHDYIQEKQHKAQQELAKKLRSTEYIAKLQRWEQFLKQPVTKKPTASHANIIHVASQRIWKVYKRAMKEGHAINDQSPAEELHELRKTCKKLRYLLEFFQNLYPENKMRRLIKILKNFQDILGDYQDYEVQEHTLKQFGEAMMQRQTPAETFLAMGVLVQNLHNRRIEARQKFASRFKTFKQEQNQQLFKSLFNDQ